MSALTDLFTSLANKIRSKLGTSTTYTPAEAISAIDDVYTKGVNDTFSNAQEKTVTAGTSAASVTPDSGKLLSKVTYNPTPSQSKSASPSTSAQTISPDSGKLLSSVSISAISPQRSANTAATLTGRDSAGPYVYFPYGWWPQSHATYGCYTRLTEAQGIACARTQTKSTTASRSAQTISPDSNYLLSSVSIAKYPDASGTYTASSRNASLDMGATNNLRYVNTNSVPNSNSGTYTPSTHGTALDMGATNTYRYVNTTNAYNAGVLAGRAQGSAMRLYCCCWDTSHATILFTSVYPKSVSIGTAVYVNGSYQSGDVLKIMNSSSTVVKTVNCNTSGSYTSTSNSIAFAQLYISNPNKVLKEVYVTLTFGY